MVTSFNVFDPSRQPMAMQALSEGERLVVWSYRRWVIGMQTHEEGHWIRVWRELGCVLGVDGARNALAGLQRMIREVALHARRPVRLHPPCCGVVCADELSVVNLVASCQAGHHAHARRIAEWIVRTDGVGDLIEAGRILGEALAERGIRLPGRARTDTGMANWAGLETDTGPSGLATPTSDAYPAESARSAKDLL